MCAASSRKAGFVFSAPGLVGADADANLAADAPRLQSHLAARSLKPLSRYVLPSHSCGDGLGVAAIEAAHHRAEVAEIRTKHRQIGVGDHRIGQPFSTPASA